MSRLTQELGERHISCQVWLTPSHLAGRRNSSGPKLGLASDPLTYPWTAAQFGACADTDLGQPGAAGSLINQVSPRELAESFKG